MTADNPYAASSASTTTQEPGFEPLGKLTTAISWILGGSFALLAFVDLVDMVAYAVDPSLLALDESVPMSDASAVLLLAQGVAGGISVLGHLVALPLWTSWHARAARNAERLGNPTGIAPGWHWGWWFVPIANLFMPYRALNRTFAASMEENEGFEGDGLDRPAVRPPGTMALWWGCYLIGNFLANTSFRLSMGDSAQLGTFIGWVSTPFALVALVLYLGHLRRIGQLQQARIERRAATS